MTREDKAVNQQKELLEKPTPPKSRRGSFIGPLALIVALLSLLATFFAWQLGKSLHLNVASRLQTMQSILEQTTVNQRQQQLALNQLQSQLQTQLANTTERALADTENLVTLAHYNLAFLNNATTAQKILETADQKLQSIN